MRRMECFLRSFLDGKFVFLPEAEEEHALAKQGGALLEGCRAFGKYFTILFTLSATSHFRNTWRGNSCVGWCCLLFFEGQRPKVWLTYAAGKREQDADGLGPGTYYAAAILKLLFDNDVQCFSDLMIPGDIDRDSFLQPLADANSCVEISIVLQTAALYESRDSLKEIYHAQTSNLEILPLRFDRELPETGDEWPGIERSDLDGIIWLSALQMGFCKLNSTPSPPYTVGDQPTVLKHFVEDVKMRLGCRTSARSFEIAAGSAPKDDLSFMQNQDEEAGYPMSSNPPGDEENTSRMGSPPDDSGSQLASSPTPPNGATDPNPSDAVPVRPSRPDLISTVGTSPGISGSTPDVVQGQELGEKSEKRVSSSTRKLARKRGVPNPLPESLAKDKDGDENAKSPIELQKIQMAQKRQNDQKINQTEAMSLSETAAIPRKKGTSFKTNQTEPMALSESSAIPKKKGKSLLAEQRVSVPMSDGRDAHSMPGPRKKMKNPPADPSTSQPLTKRQIAPKKAGNREELLKETQGTGSQRVSKLRQFPTKDSVNQKPGSGNRTSASKPTRGTDSSKKTKPKLRAQQTQEEKAMPQRTLQA